MEQKQQEIAEVTVQRSTKVGSKYVERGTVLKIGSEMGEISTGDARILLNTKKALPGKQTRIINEAKAAKTAVAEADK
ncbi:hypothetical protein Misp06_00818 [Microbulbifer sp. NBRC 101763]|uniref:hypothetical protein n=1 Tax=Microbulbifer sp. NBRC 101763 TaxID=1113820 RepID=UPI0030B77C03